MIGLVLAGQALKAAPSGQAQVGLDPYIDPDSLTLCLIGAEVKSQESDVARVERSSVLHWSAAPTSTSRAISQSR